MTDIPLETALARLAPKVDDTAEWDDVVRRARPRARAGWKLAAGLAAALLAVGLVAGALAGGVLSGSLDRLSSWIGDQPGEPSPQQQALFDEENSASYAHFPAGTHVGRLLTFEFRRRSHDLLGFRDGSNLCIRISPPLHEGIVAPAECVPAAELARLGDPVALLGGSRHTIITGSSGQMMIAYGLAADSVVSVEALDRGRSLGTVDVHNNAFFMAVPNEGDFGDKPIEEPPLLLRAHTSRGAIDVRVPLIPFRRPTPAEDIPGPTHAERALDAASVGWLERGEPRGEPFSWPYRTPTHVLYSRVVRPDPTSSFRLGVAFGEDADWRENGRWYCLAWFWPLLPESKTGWGCGRADMLSTGLTLEGTWTSSYGEFPQFVGIASDQVARLKLFYKDGSTKEVPIVDNLFSFYVDGAQASKLVAYDSVGRVVRIMRLT